jgi:hypothetical protein
MTQDEMIELAKQAGLKLDELPDEVYLPLEQFAKLVAEKERKWVGLTDDEQRNIAYSDINCWDWGELMDATEAKLKQKNGFAEEIT